MIASTRPLVNRLKNTKLDGFLLTVILASFIICLYGINWGVVESWHPDQMAFGGFLKEGKHPLNPGEFLKPPFYKYYILFLARVPLIIFGNIFRIPTHIVDALIMIWAGILSIFLFLGSIVLVFQITKRSFGIFASRIVTIVYATSADIIVNSKFLTTDVPVTCGMLLAFYYCQNILLKGRLRDYVLAGFFTGIATATKYNGLAVGIAIVTAHVLSLNSVSWKKLLLSKNLALGLLTVFFGFFVGNPFALFDYSTFISDFLYNNAITPVYTGETGNSYWEFIALIPTIIGWPAFCIFSIAVLISLYLVFSDKENWMEKKAMLLLISVVVLYYLKFGSFPRVVPRFILPIVPLLLIMSSPLWNRLKSYKKVISIFLVFLIGYNTICSIYAVRRFVEDPRMIAREWVKVNIPKGSSVEQTVYSPNMEKLPEMKFISQKMPFIGGRKRVFEQQFKDSESLVEKIPLAEKEADDAWYSLDQLMIRKPDYILLNSFYYGRFTTGRSGEYYPSVKQFFNDLIDEKYPYKIIFDQRTKAPPSWVYPQKIQFLQNRMIILARKDT
ncbi:glycosyltransferase family 39 protein [Nostocales cyanobacterium LEGE 11386]|nr:glycosyltransferase family 39 protein [Nostocales cyanobacterium LEGE 11386]